MKIHTRIQSVFSRPKVQQQLVIIFILVLIIPVSLCGILLYQSQKSLTRHYKEQTESDNLRVKSILFDVTTNLYNVSQTIAGDSILPELLTKEYASDQEAREAIDKYPTITGILNRDTSIYSLDIYALNDTICDYDSFHPATEGIRNSDWFKEAASNASPFWRTKNRTDKYGTEYWNLTLYRRITLPKAHTFAVLVVTVSDNYMRNRIDNTQMKSILSVNQDPVFYSSTRAYQGIGMPADIDYSAGFYTAAGAMELLGCRYMAAISTIVPLNTDDKMYILTYNPGALEDVNAVLRTYVLIIMSTMLIPCLLFFVYSHYFSARVMTLRKAMYQASRGNYDIMDSFTGSDELSETFQDLRVMIDEIKDKEAQIYQARIREQEIINHRQQMEFKVLASQINPHFLYNTLETIRMKAFTNGDREVANAIKLLGKSLRYVLENTGTVSISLEKELSYIHTYISIQKLRFGDRVNYTEQIQADLDLNQYTILPLMLQPIVENAISHGLEGRETDGQIVLEIFEDDTASPQFLCIHIKDNGNGMTAQELEALRIRVATRDETRTRSIGLYNIDQRLLLCYGPNCRLEIYSTLGVGTTVCLRLPIGKVRMEETL